MKQENSKTETRLSPLEEDPQPSVSGESPLPRPAVQGGPAWRRPIGETVTAGSSSPARPWPTATQALSSYPREKGQGVLSHRPDNCCPEPEAGAPMTGSTAQRARVPSSLPGGGGQVRGWTGPALEGLCWCWQGAFVKKGPKRALRPRSPGGGEHHAAWQSPVRFPPSPLPSEAQRELWAPLRMRPLETAPLRDGNPSWWAASWSRDDAPSAASAA